MSAAEPPTEAPQYDPRVQHWRDLLQSQVEGRKIILCMGVVAATTASVRTLAALGAGPFLSLGHHTGAGALPDPEIAEWAIVGDLPDGLTISEQIHAYCRALEDLSPEVTAQIDAFDPDRTALVLPGFPYDFTDVAGRPNSAPRQPEWIALEDKVGLDALWDALGVERSPSIEVPVDRSELERAHAALDQGDGTVWACDARDGFTGGATGVRWIRTAKDMDEAVAFFGARSDRVRVMPFLEGVPCSVHGMVLGDDIIVLRPCEMVVVRRDGDSKFQYAGASTWWDPAPEDRAAMRAVARRVAEGLVERFGFQGTFTVDGVMTVDGFRPTELNPRFGAAIGNMTRALPGLPMVLLDLFARAGVPLDWKAAELEALIIESADSNRLGGGWATSPGHREDSVTHDIVWTGTTYRFAEEGETPDGTLMCGPAADGTFTRFMAAPDRAPVGESVAPRVIEAFRLSDRELGSAFGPLSPSKSVR